MNHEPVRYDYLTDVKCHTGSIHQRLEKVLHQLQMKRVYKFITKTSNKEITKREGLKNLSVIVPNSLCWNLQVVTKIWSTRQVLQKMFLFHYKQ